MLDAALRFLEVRSRSVAEVRRRLTSAGYRPELVEAAIARLLDLGMLDDAGFARLWVESRDRAHPRGEQALIIELRQKGVEATVITATIKARREAAVRWEDAPAPIDEGALSHSGSPDAVAAGKLLARHARSLARIADPRLRRQRAYALLARNGFDPETCRTLAATVTTGASEPDAEVADPD